MAVPSTVIVGTLKVPSAHPCYVPAEGRGEREVRRPIKLKRCLET